MKTLLSITCAFFLLSGVAAAQITTKGGSSGAGAQRGSQMSGVFDSKRGVMHRVSCYGYNIGEFVSDEVVYIVCFDRLEGGEDLDINCKEDRIWVKGYFEQKSAPSGGPCQQGTENVFYVTEWRCQ